MQCESCGENVGRLEIELPPGCDDPVFRMYCRACEAAERGDTFDADELGIDPEEDVEAWRN